MFIGLQDILLCKVYIKIFCPFFYPFEGSVGTYSQCQCLSNEYYKYFCCVNYLSMFLIVSFDE